jgi:hypothetical protein
MHEATRSTAPVPKSPAGLTRASRSTSPGRPVSPTKALALAVLRGLLAQTTAPAADRAARKQDLDWEQSIS